MLLPVLDCHKCLPIRILIEGVAPEGFSDQDHVLISRKEPVGLPLSEDLSRGLWIGKPLFQEEILIAEFC